jgi:hypothetical protein
VNMGYAAGSHLQVRQKDPKRTACFADSASSFQPSVSPFLPLPSVLFLA